MILELKASLKSLYGIVHDSFGNTVDAQQVVPKTAAGRLILRRRVFMFKPRRAYYNFKSHRG